MKISNKNVATKTNHIRCRAHLTHLLSYKIAFTLAETLITLAIIGIVAAMTIPGIVQKYEEKVTVVKVKKVYSLLSNALQLAEFENGTFNNTISGTVSENFYDYISPYLKIEKYCGSNEGCWADTTIKFLHGADWENINTYRAYQKAVMNDGMLLQLFTKDTFAVSGEIRVDINGYKKPNTLGKDIFKFTIDGNKILPYGMASTNEEETFSTHCNLTSENNYNGDACTAWVIYNENMDYLHCNDLSWDGKKSCKQKDYVNSELLFLKRR